MLYNGTEFDTGKGTLSSLLKYVWKKIYPKFIDYSATITSALSSYYTSASTDTLLITKLNKSKAVDLTNFIQTEVFNAMLRLQNKMRTYVYKAMLDSISGTMTGGIGLVKSTDNIITAFSYAGVILKGKTLLTTYVADYPSIVEATKADMDYIKIDNGTQVKIYFNPDLFTNQEASDCSFLVENKTIITDGDIATLLAPVSSGGIGNAGNTTATVLPALIASY